MRPGSCFLTTSGVTSAGLVSRSDQGKPNRRYASCKGEACPKKGKIQREKRGFESPRSLNPVFRRFRVENLPEDAYPVALKRLDREVDREVDLGMPFVVLRGDLELKLIQHQRPAGFRRSRKRSLRLLWAPIRRKGRAGVRRSILESLLWRFLPCVMFFCYASHSLVVDHRFRNHYHRWRSMKSCLGMIPGRF